MTAPDTTALTNAQREAMERNLGGGLVGYVHRIRRDHGPYFIDGIYVGCRCGAMPCGLDRLVVHMDDLRRAYELKVEDFAAETRRADDLRAKVARVEALAADIKRCATDDGCGECYGVAGDLRAALDGAR